MADRERVKRVVRRAIAVPLVIAAAGFVVYFIFQGALDRRPAVSLGDNSNYALPKAEAGAAAVTSADLVENAAAWNGRAVVFTGEAVGELMARGDGAWLHLNDDAYQRKNISQGAAPAGYNSGHAVWVSAAEAGKIKYYGDHTHGGDIVTATGVFNAACREHGGDMDIHASSLKVVSPGRIVSHPFNLPNAVIALALCLAAAGLFVLRRVASRK